MKYILLLIGLWIPSWLFCQNDQPAPLGSEEDLYERYRLAEQMVMSNIQRDNQKALAYTDSLIIIASLAGNDSLRQRASYLRAGTYRQLGKYEEALDLLDSYTRHVRAQNDTAQLIRALTLTGANYLRMGENLTAQVYLMEALELAEITQAKSFIAQISNTIAVNFRAIGQLEETKFYLQKSFDMADELGNGPVQVMALNGLGLIYRDQDSLTKAQDIFEKALKIAEETDFLVGIATQSRNLGVIAQRRGKLSTAETY